MYSFYSLSCLLLLGFKDIELFCKTTGDKRKLFKKLNSEKNLLFNESADSYLISCSQELGFRENLKNHEALARAAGGSRYNVLAAPKCIHTLTFHLQNNPMLPGPASPPAWELGQLKPPKMLA